MRRLLPYLMLAFVMFAAQSGVELLYCDLDSTVFTISVPGFTSEQRFMDSLYYDILQVEGGGFQSAEEGQPMLPQLRFDIAIPGSSFTVAFDILDDTTYSDIRPFPKTESIKIEEQKCRADRWSHIVQPDFDVYHGTAPFPRDNVRIDSYIFMNEVKVLNLYLTPLVFQPPDKIYMTRRLRVSIAHIPDGRSFHSDLTRLGPTIVNPQLLDLNGVFDE